jgi:tetratricopeptide (TPR) repeat protein
VHLLNRLSLNQITTAVFLAAILLPLPLLADEGSSEEVPYGVASSYLYGRQMLAEGNIEEALRYLHFAYRTHPEVPTVAWDFQEGLVAGQFFKDAIEVLDKLVESWPDSALYRYQRSQVNLKLGHNKEALADLRELRKQGRINLDLIVGEATILASTNHPDEALDVCREGIALLPENGPRLYLTMSVILDQEGRNKELPPLLEEAVTSYPDSPQLRDIQVRGLLSVGKDEEALEAAREADRYFSEKMNAQDPDGDAALDLDESQNWFPEMPTSFVVELADIYAQQGAPEKAIEVLDPMFEAGTLGRDPSLWLARLYQGTGSVPRGREIVEQILARWPNSGQAWLIRGQGLGSEGRQEEALVDFAKAVEFAPNDPQVRLGYVRGMLLAWEGALRSLDKTPEQERQMAQLLDQAKAAALLVSDADAEGQLILGYAFHSTRQLEQAASAFELASRLPGLHVPASLRLSVCLDDMGEEAKARAVLDALRDRYPDDAEVANSLGYYLAEKGTDLDLAEKLIKQALKSAPGTGAYLDSMGWVLYKKGETAEAFDFIIKAVNVLPDDPIILEHLGLVLLELGQSEEAEEMLRRALAVGGDRARIQAHLDNLVDRGGEE